jgi:hypothetical protein
MQRPNEGHNLINTGHMSLAAADRVVYTTGLRIPVGLSITAFAATWRLTLNAGRYFHGSKADEA